MCIVLNNSGVSENSRSSCKKKLIFEYCYWSGCLYHTRIYTVGRGLEAKVEKIVLTSILKKKKKESEVLKLSDFLMTVHLNFYNFCYKGFGLQPNQSVLPSREVLQLPAHTEKMDIILFNSL